MILRVDTAARTIDLGGDRIDCAIGRGGACAAADKREGDGCTPIGDWPLRTVLLRPDRGIRPPLSLPWRWLRPDDGWSDDSVDPDYDRPVRHPHAHSAERLWREDGLYDAIVTLRYDVSPRRTGAGSAIFLHVRAGETTAGCVAIPREAMARLLQIAAPGDVMRVV